MIPLLENLREESLLTLSPAGQDQVAPRVLSVLFGVSIHILQSSTVHAVVQACSCQVVVGIKVVWLHIPHIARWVDEAVQQICGDGHCTPIVTDEEARGTPFAQVAPSLKSVVCRLEVTLYIPNKFQDLVQSIQAGIDPVDHEPHIDVCDPFMLAICLEDQEDGSSPAELRRALQQWGHECTLSDEFPQMLKRDALHAEGLPYGTKANVPQIESVLTLEDVMWDGALVRQHQLNTVEVECHHLKRK